jgi:dTDP-4-dehydrorhamnose 3,5-epimerase
MDWQSALQGREPVLSEKDRRLPTLAEFDSPFVFEG